MSDLTPQQRIEQDLKTAMKAQDKMRTGTLRMLLAEIKNEKIRAGGTVDEPGFLGVVRKAVKQRKDAAEQFRTGGRTELADKEEAEAEILATYLPQQVSEDEIRSAIEELVKSQGLSGPKDIGKVMPVMLARFRGTADGGTLNRIAREVLTG